MATYYENLPKTKSCEHSSIRWTPSSTERGGHLEISQGRKVCHYYLVEIEASHGRAVRCVKVGANPAAEDAAYDTFLPEHGSRYHPFCACKGFSRHSLCKHVAAFAAILENRWFPDQISDDERRAEVASKQGVWPTISEDEMPECFRGVGTTSDSCPF